jgi:hypothetical protein
MEQEVFEVLQRPRIAPKIAPVFFDNLRKMFAAAEPVTITERRVAACRDPKDDKFLELAVNGRADVIVSGDADLLVLDTFRAAAANGLRPRTSPPARRRPARAREPTHRQSPWRRQSSRRSAPATDAAQAIQ